jgi:N-acetylglutamate synthase-like GNAT family acetyltransferase
LVEYALRPATKSDFLAIRTLIREARINPTGLDWRRFTVAVSSPGEVIACGQIKPVPGGLRELASLAVRSEYRRRGIATDLIRHLCSGAPRPLYLTCRAALGEFYRQYGFMPVGVEAMPHYYRRLQRLVSAFLKASGSADGLLVMKLG